MLKTLLSFWKWLLGETEPAPKVIPAKVEPVKEKPKAKAIEEFRQR